jgi:hypothetical protein
MEIVRGISRFPASIPSQGLLRCPHSHWAGRCGFTALRITFSNARRACGRGKVGLLARRIVRAVLPCSGRNMMLRVLSEGAASAGIKVVPYPAATRLTRVSRLAACQAPCRSALRPQACRVWLKLMPRYTSVAGLIRCARRLRQLPVQSKRARSQGADGTS